MRTKYLMVVVAGGLNQQRNQIVDAVVIVRILGVSFVVPILQVNVIWGDESEFSDIFDLDHFKKVLENDVGIVSSLSSTHVMIRPVEKKMTQLYATPEWIRSRNHRRIEHSRERERDVRPTGELQIERNKGVYVAVDDDDENNICSLELKFLDML